MYSLTNIDLITHIHTYRGAFKYMGVTRALHLCPLAISSKLLPVDVCLSTIVKTRLRQATLSQII